MPWFPRVPPVLVFLTKKRSAASSSPAARSLIPPSCNASSPLHKPRWPRFLPPPAPQSLLPCRSSQPGVGPCAPELRPCINREFSAYELRILHEKCCSVGQHFSWIHISPKPKSCSVPLTKRCTSVG